MASASAQLSQLLLAAASGDARVRQPAQERLHELESRATFLPALLETYATQNLSFSKFNHKYDILT